MRCWSRPALENIFSIDLRTGYTIGRLPQEVRGTFQRKWGSKGIAAVLMGSDYDLLVTACSTNLAKAHLVNLVTPFAFILTLSSEDMFSIKHIYICVYLEILYVYIFIHLCRASP